MSVRFWFMFSAVLCAALLCVLLFASCTSRRTEDAVLSFHSFDGGGPEYTVTVEDPSVISVECARKYAKSNHEKLSGAGYTETFTFKGLRAGETKLTVSAQSPITGNTDTQYIAVVDDTLHVTLTKETTVPNSSKANDDPIAPVPTLVMSVGDVVLYPGLADTPAAETFVEKLSQGELRIEMHDSDGFEKVGALPWGLPQDDVSVTTQPGDILLYQGNQLCLCYDADTRRFTRLARIDGVSRARLLSVLSQGDATVSFWVEWSE